MPRSRKFKYDVQMCKDLLNEIGGEKDPFLEHVRQLRYEGVLKIGIKFFDFSCLSLQVNMFEVIAISKTLFWRNMIQIDKAYFFVQMIA